MKNGNIVKLKKNGRIGMITWRKSNQEIGVNFSGYGIVMQQKDIIDKKKHLMSMGADDVWSKEELELVSTLK